MSKMSKSITFAFILAAAIAPAVVLAAPVKVDKCAHPKNIQAQCFIEIGARCDPATGRLSGSLHYGTIRGEGLLDQCMDRKRQQGRR
jgi:hypothetical protein